MDILKALPRTLKATQASSLNDESWWDISVLYDSDSRNVYRDYTLLT